MNTMQSTVEIKLLGAGDEAILQSVATEVFDDPIHPNAAAEFLSDPRHHIAVTVEKTSSSGLSARCITFILTNQALNGGSTKSA